MSVNNGLKTLFRRFSKNVIKPEQSFIKVKQNVYFDKDSNNLKNPWNFSAMNENEFVNFFFQLSQSFDNSSQ